MADDLLAGGVSETLIAVAGVLNAAKVPWMVIGGAAMALHGVADGSVNDIDICLTAADADAMGKRLTWTNHADDSSLRFRSDFLMRPDFGPLPVELLGGFRIWDGRGWIGVNPDRAVAFRLGGQGVFVPGRDHLAEIFRLCGREQDLRRAALLAR